MAAVTLVATVAGEGTPVTTGAAGAVVSTVQETVSGEPVLPGTSIAFTAKLCNPSARSVRANGDVQAEYSPPSTEQAKVAPVSPLIEIDADLLFVKEAGAPLSTGAAGGVVSTVQLAVAAEPVLPAASVALTARLCGPSARPLSATGEEQAEYSPPSTEHEKVAPSSALIEMDADLLCVREAGEPLSSGAAGPVVSTVHEAVAGSLVLPAPSTALTSTVCPPSTRPLRLLGDEHAEYAPPSTEQVKLAPSSPLNATLAEVDCV